MNFSMYSNIHAVAPNGQPTPGIWYPYGVGHRVIFDANGSFRVWDRYQWQHLGDQLYARVEEHMHRARTDADGDLLEMMGWGHVTPGKIVGMIMDACNTAEVVDVLCNDRSLVSLIMNAYDALN